MLKSLKVNKKLYEDKISKVYKVISNMDNKSYILKVFELKNEVSNFKNNRWINKENSNMVKCIFSWISDENVNNELNVNKNSNGKYLYVLMEYCYLTFDEFVNTKVFEFFQKIKKISKNIQKIYSLKYIIDLYNSIKNIKKIKKLNKIETNQIFFKKINNQYVLKIQFLENQDFKMSDDILIKEKNTKYIIDDTKTKEENKIEDEIINDKDNSKNSKKLYNEITEEINYLNMNKSIKEKLNINNTKIIEEKSTEDEDNEIKEDFNNFISKKFYNKITEKNNSCSMNKSIKENIFKNNIKDDIKINSKNVDATKSNFKNNFKDENLNFISSLFSIFFKLLYPTEKNYNKNLYNLKNKNTNTKIFPNIKKLFYELKNKKLVRDIKYLKNIFKNDIFYNIFGGNFLENKYLKIKILFEKNLQKKDYYLYIKNNFLYLKKNIKQKKFKHILNINDYQINYKNNEINFESKKLINFIIEMEDSKLTQDLLNLILILN